MNWLEQVIGKCSKNFFATVRYKNDRPVSQKRVILRSWLGIGITAAAGITNGAQGVLGKYAYEGHANVQTLLTIRFIVATLIVEAVLVVLHRRQKLPLRQPKRKLVGFSALGLLYVAIALFYFLALKLLPASTTSLLYYVYPAFIVLWSTFFFKEKLSLLQLVALVLALGGCFLTVDPLGAFASITRFNWIGILLAFACALSSSWYAILADRVSKGTPSFLLAAYSLPVTAFCFLLWFSITLSFRIQMNLEGWLSCLVIGVLAGVSVYLLLVGISLIGASQAAIVATTEPVTAVALAALLLAEPLTLTKLCGGLCITLAIVLLSQSKVTQKIDIVSSAGSKEEM
ncbi:MAG: DMT family transporter [Ktedonobacteraceae bacterium]|nr:DMT family transporter [Ktedonobacteraceae bacterium]